MKRLHMHRVYRLRGTYDNWRIAPVMTSPDAALRDTSFDWIVVANPFQPLRAVRKSDLEPVTPIFRMFCS